MAKDKFQLSEITNELDDEREEDEDLIEEDEEDEESENLNVQARMAKMKSLHNLKSVSVAILVAAGLLSSNAMAQTTNTNTANTGGPFGTLRNTSWYLGASVGKTQGDIDTNDIGGGFSGSVDDRDTGWKVYGGGMFNRNIGVELGYVDLGTTSIRGNIGAVTTNMDAETEGISLALVGAIPLGQFTSYGQGLSLTGKVGIFRWKSDDTRFSCAGASCTTRGEIRDTDPLIGVGLKYDFHRNLALRLDYEQYQNVANTDYNLWTVGLQAGF